MRQEAKVMYKWLSQHCPDFIDKDSSRPPNSPDLNPLWRAEMGKFNKLKTKPENVVDLKMALQALGYDLPNKTIHKSVELSQMTRGVHQS